MSSLFFRCKNQLKCFLCRFHRMNREPEVLLGNILGILLRYHHGRNPCLLGTIGLFKNASHRAHPPCQGNLPRHCHILPYLPAGDSTDQHSENGRACRGAVNIAAPYDIDMHIVVVEVFACYLAGIRNSRALESSFLKGRFVETWIANEIRKSYMNNGVDQPVGYYRDERQNEIDLVILRDARLMLLECKSGTNFNYSAVKAFECLDNTKYEKGINALICTSSEPYSISEDVLALPISAI